MASTGQHQPEQMVSHYRLLRRLGAGGMGEVYLAEDTQLGRQVAIKFLTAPSDDPETRRRLLNEARAAAALDHPNICAVHEVSAQSDPPFIVMQYVEGETLAARLRRGPLAPDDVLRVGLDVADGLSAAHRRGIVHRDVKPQNIVLTPSGHAKLLDFGLARQRPPDIPAGSEPTQTVTHVGIVGTPAYMAPEQIQSGTVDGRTDLFALGAVIYEGLTGMPPFSGRSQIDVFASILHVDPPPPSSLRPGLTAAHDQLCARLLKKNPDDRPQSASDLVTALRELGAASQRVEKPPRQASFTRRSFLAITGVLILTVLGTLSIVRPRPLSLDPAPEAADWYARGVAALQEGSYFRATRSLQRAVQLDDRYPFGWARLAEAQLELDEEDSAAASVLRAVSLVDDRSRLPQDERLAFEATIGMVNRDYAAAQTAYSALLGQRPGSAQVRLDLGRAYEASEAIDKAIEQYREASRLDPDNPAAFLRLGVLFGRQDETQAALDVFDRAEELYAAATNVEGIAAVSLQRGIVLGRLGDRWEEARAALERAEKLGESVGSTYLRASALFRLSSLAGTRGRYDEAEQFARRALEIGRGHDSLTAFGLVDLGNVFVYSEQYDRAAQYFDQALRLAGAARARRAEARARLATASLQMSRGHVEEATRNAQASLEYYERAGFRGLSGLALTLLAQGQAHTGDLAGAQKSYEELLERAAARNVASQVAELHNQMAGVLLMRERYETALQHCDEALVMFRRMSAPYDIVHASLLRVHILGRLGRFAEAERQIQSVARTPGSGVSEAGREIQQRLLLARGTLALLRGQAAAALALARGGLDASVPDGLEDIDVELQLVRALAQTRSGRAAAGLSTLERAESTARGLANAVLSAHLSLAKTETLLALGRVEAVLALAPSLGDRFERDGQFESAWLSYSVAARASALRADADQARTWQERATRAQHAFEETLSPAARLTWRERQDLPPVVH